MYLATSGRAKKPWYVPQLNKKIYTFDGFCHCVADYVQYFVHDFEEGKVLHWLETELQIQAVADELKVMKNEGRSVLEQILWLMGVGDDSKTLDLQRMKEAYLTYIAIPPQLQNKLKGDHAFRAGAWKHARQYYKSAQAIEYSVAVDNNLGVVYLALDDCLRAGRAFDRCIEREDGLLVRLNRIRLSLRHKDYQMMLSDLAHISRLYDTGDIWYYYGVAYEGTGCEEEALGAYTKALDVSYDDKYLKAFVHCALKQQGESIISEWQLDHPLSRDQRLFTQAQIALAAGDDDTYLSCMESAIDICGEKIEYIFEITECHIRKGRINKALEFLSRVPVEEQHFEVVIYYKMIIANAAGNTAEFEEQVAVLTNKWKDEARKATVR